MKTVFDTKPSSGYDDDVTRRYHFPNRYMEIVKSCLGDWVLLRRPRADGGDLAYFAAAHVESIYPDPVDPGRSYAGLSSFLPFDAPVPWFAAGRYAEGVLRDLRRPQVGVYLRGRSVRPLDDADFVAIVTAGLKETVDPANARRFDLDPTSPHLLGFLSDDPPEARAREIERALEHVQAFPIQCGIPGWAEACESSVAKRRRPGWGGRTARTCGIG